MTRLYWRSDAFSVLACTGVDFNLVALRHKDGHTDLKTGGDLGGLQNLAGRVALDCGLGPGDFAGAGPEVQRLGVAQHRNHQAVAGLGRNAQVHRPVARDDAHLVVEAGVDLPK